MAKKDKEKKEQKKCEKHEEQRGMVLETLNELSDFCLENIVAIKPLLDDENDAVAACAEDRIYPLMMYLPYRNAGIWTPKWYVNFSMPFPTQPE